MPNEMQLPLDAIFAAGVRPSHDTPINAPAMVAMRGLRPAPGGAEIPPALTDIGYSKDTNSRYLHLHKGSRRSFLLAYRNLLPFDMDTEDFSLNVECLLDGTFSTGVPWSGTNWTISGGKATHTAGNTAALTQSGTDALFTPVEGYIYRVTFTVSGRTAGTIQARVGNGTGTVRSTNATFTELIRAGAGGSFTFVPSSDFDGALDNASIEILDDLVLDMTECIAPTAATNVSNGNFASGASDWTAGTGWAVTTSGAAHTPGNTAALTQASADWATLPEKGEVYRISWLMESTAGTLTPQLGANIGTAREGSGGFEQDILATVSSGGTTIDLTFTPSTDFNGTITFVSVKHIPRLTWPTGTSSENGGWEVADFGDVLFAVRPDIVLARLPYYSNFRWAGFTRETEANATSIPCATSHMGRMWLGGLSSDLFTYGGTSAEQERWARLWRVIMDRAMPNTFTHKRLVMDGKTAFLTTASGGDLDYPFVQEMAMLGFPLRTAAATQLDEAALDIAGKREILAYPLPWRKDILRILPLGNGVVYYCGDGISYLELTPEGLRHVKVKALGLAQRTALTGNLLTHTFADQTGKWWRLKADLTLELLDFQDDLGTVAADTNLTLTYDEEEGDVYIHAGTAARAFLIPPTGGWTELNTGLVTGVQGGNGLLGITTTPHTDDLFYLETNTFDMGEEWQKIITSIQLSVLDASSVQCAIRYMTDKASSTFYTLPWTLLNPSNGVRPNTNGRAFRFLFRGTLGTRTKVERAMIYWRPTEKKSSASAVNATTGYELI